MPPFYRATLAKASTVGKMPRRITGRFRHRNDLQPLRRGAEFEPEPVRVRMTELRRRRADD
jgi:hypothetical protein